MSTNDEKPGAAVVAPASARSAILGAIFLMATSAIGPGFITQTTEFTAQLGAAFAFAIVASVLVDIAVQLNVWRVIGVAGKRAHELANEVLPGLGYLLTALVVLGGLVFNIGNTAGTGLGTEAMLGLDPKVGGAISAAIAIAIFLSKRAGVALDRIVVVLGVLMIGLTTYVAITSAPPVGDALRESVIPYDESSEFLVITTLIGGTVGGYITYAGAHRLLDTGITGAEHVRAITRSSVTSILVTGVMRILLFLAILGVVAGGAELAANPASAFEVAAGEAGRRLFGIIYWSAAITSVIGASYTSVSFMTRTSTSPRTRNILTVAFIVVTAVIYLLIGTAPVELLIFAGAFNGLILPVGFGVLLWIAWRRRDLLQGYVYPVWLLLVGVLAWLLTVYLAYEAMKGLQDL